MCCTRLSLFVHVVPRKAPSVACGTARIEAKKAAHNHARKARRWQVINQVLNWPLLIVNKAPFALPDASERSSKLICTPVFTTWKDYLPAHRISPGICPIPGCGLHNSAQQPNFSVLVISGHVVLDVEAGEECTFLPPPKHLGERPISVRPERAIHALSTCSIRPYTFKGTN